MIEQLKEYVQNNNLHEKAIDDFWIAFNNWKNDCPEQYNKTFKNISIDDVDVFVHSIGLRSSEYPACDYNHVSIGVLIHFGERQLGNYRVLYPLNDDIDGDDILEIY